jgi:hypothetical protein
MARLLPKLDLPAPLPRVLSALLLSLALAAALLLPASALAAVPKPQRPSTDPVALALALAERYWHGRPACGTPTILTSAHQLPDSAYESTTSPEPASAVVEMWTETQKCTITINTSLWPGWHEDDEFFQWFCDAMTHEVGHLFGHADGGQTDPASITYPFLSSTSANFDSVPECRAVTLQYGAQQIRGEEVLHRR